MIVGGGPPIAAYLGVCNILGLTMIAFFGLQHQALLRS